MTPNHSHCPTSSYRINTDLCKTYFYNYPIELTNSYWSKREKFIHFMFTHIWLLSWLILIGCTSIVIYFSSLLKPISEAFHNKITFSDIYVCYYCRGYFHGR